jgi:hypothetical protein
LETLQIHLKHVSLEAQGWNWEHSLAQDMDRKQEPSGLQKDKERGGILKNLDIQNYIRHTIIQCPLKYPAKSETFHLNKAIESL